MWHKRRWYCTEPACPRTSFTEQVPKFPARARITARLREAAGHRVCVAGPRSSRPPATWHCPGPLSWRRSFPPADGSPRPRCSRSRCWGSTKTRRGRARWKQDPDTGRRQPVADRRHTGFVDAHSIQGLLGQVEGRAPCDVVAWPTTPPRTWREQIRYMAIDMSTSYRAAVRIGLPHATVVVDHFHFHVVQLANTPVIGATLLVAWIAKERLRKLLATARTSADRERIGHLRRRFLTWCADSEIPEVRQLAITVDRWWRKIEAFIRTGHSNAKSKGINRMIKLTARATRGFRNPQGRCKVLSLPHRQIIPVGHRDYY
ncbi:transposase [Streptacidiphilus sp. PAMC 29251]